MLPDVLRLQDFSRAIARFQKQVMELDMLLLTLNFKTYLKQHMWFSWNQLGKTWRHIRSCTIYCSQLVNEIGDLVWKQCWSCISTLIAYLLRKAVYNTLKCKCYGRISCWASSAQLPVNGTPTAVHGGRLGKNIWGAKDATSLDVFFQRAVCKGSPCCAMETSTSYQRSDFSLEGLPHQCRLNGARHQEMLNYDQFLFPQLFPFLQLSLSKSQRKHVPSLYILLPPFPFISIFCIEAACFISCVLWDIACLITLSET